MTELRKACQHGRWEEHNVMDGRYPVGVCPGGTPVLPSDLLALLGGREAVEDKVKNMVYAWCHDLNQYAKQQFVADIMALFPEVEE